MSDTDDNSNMTVGLTSTEANRPEDTRARAVLVERVCDRIRGGTPINHACALERVTRSAFYKWLAEDEEIGAMVAEARAESAESMRKELLELIRSEAKTSNSMLHLIERQHPDEYAPAPKKVEVSGDPFSTLASAVGDALRGKKAEESSDE